MAESCCVSSCRSRACQGGEPHLKFYRFPRDEKHLSMWKNKLKVRRIIHSSRVCSIHFTEKDYMLTNLGWKILIPDAVPSLNLPKKSSSSRVISATEHVDQHTPSVSCLQVLKHVDGVKNSMLQLQSSGSASTISGRSSFKDLSKPQLTTLFDFFLRSNVSEERKQLLRRKSVAMSNSLILNLHCKEQNEARYSQSLNCTQTREDDNSKCTVSAENGNMLHTDLPSIVSNCNTTVNFIFEDNGAESVLSNLAVGSPNGTFVCKLCNLVSPSEVLHVEHSLAHQIWPCYACYDGFRNYSELANHYVKHVSEKRLFCSFCGKGFIFYPRYISHVNSHGDDKICYCKVCGTRFQNSSALMEHSVDHMKQGKMKCEHCQKNFLSVELYKAHKILHLDAPQIGEFNIRGFRDMKYDKTEFRCFLCDRVFLPRFSHQLVSHLHSHFKNGDFVWDPCLQGSESSPYSLIVASDRNKDNIHSSCYNIKLERTEVETDQHVATISNPVAVKMYEECSDDLPKFESNTSPNDDEFSCIECGERCGSSTGLTLHYEKHVKEEPCDSWSSDDENL